MTYIQHPHPTSHTVFTVEYVTVRQRTMEGNGCKKIVITDDVLKPGYDSLSLSTPVVFTNTRDQVSSAPI